MNEKQTSSTPLEVQPVDKLKVLIVDDYALTRDMVKAILRQAGFGQISAAEDGSAALEKLSAERFDLVICDWNMPRMTGIALLKTVRSRGVNSKVPFLMLTAEAYRENVAEAMGAGVSDYVVKPFTAQILSDKVSKVLQKAAKGAA